MENDKENLRDVGEFVAEYAAHMMGVGIHTSRVIRSAKRIGESYGYTTKLSVFHKSIILTLQDRETHKYFSEVVDIPAFPISFEQNSKLSALSWETFDERLPLSVVRQKYNEAISTPAIRSWVVLILASLANASFCRLFGGDWLSMGIVFLSTMAGFFIRQKLSARSVNHFIVFIVSAFVASLCASTSLLFHTTSDIAIATSVLYLIPGVPLINGVIDIVEGHTLTGFARLAQAGLLIFCIAMGLSLTLYLVKDSLL